MAYCPKCNGEMKTMDTLCPKCGYDFPDDNPAANPFHSASAPAWPYSPLANAILISGQVIAGLACVFALLGSLGAAFENQVRVMMERAVIAVLLAALVIIIARVQHMQQRQR